MLAAITAAAIHYHVTVTCNDEPCTLPIEARTIGGGGSPTPVPPTYVVLRLHIDPEPLAEPTVAWYSDDASIAFPSASNPFEHTLRLPGDTAATPQPDTLQALLIPGIDRTQHTVGMKPGETTIEAEIGAPINERVSIPVFSRGGPTPAPETTRNHAYAIRVSALGGAAGSNVHFHASVAYADPLAPTYGTTTTLFTEVPFAQSHGLTQPHTTAQTLVSPQPYAEPATTWSIDGNSAIFDHYTNEPWVALRGIAPGTSTLHAHIAAPVDRDVSIPVVTYASLALPCGNGVHFSPAGEAIQTNKPEQSDLYLTCGTLQFPAGGVLLTNGDEPARDVAAGVVRGPQFPNLTATLWRNDRTSIDLQQYRAAIRPCSKPTDTNVAMIDYQCQTMGATTLLFRTRDGRAVKWLLQTGNGLDLLAGPYQVL